MWGVHQTSERCWHITQLVSRTQKKNASKAWVGICSSCDLIEGLQIIPINFKFILQCTSILVWEGWGMALAMPFGKILYVTLKQVSKPVAKLVATSAKDSRKRYSRATCFYEYSIPPNPTQPCLKIIFWFLSVRFFIEFLSQSNEKPPAPTGQGKLPL